MSTICRPFVKERTCSCKVARGSAVDNADCYTAWPMLIAEVAKPTDAMIDAAMKRPFR